MDELVAQYLFQNKKCPLPAVGSLMINEGTASTLYRDNKIIGPIPVIEFSVQEIPAGDFTNFIAKQKNIPVQEAIQSLDKYCLALKKLNAYEEIKLDQTGKFFIDRSGMLVFKQEDFPKEFIPSVAIEQVQHPNASHSLRVGDAETTSNAMAAYYSDNENSRKEKWWIWAIVLFLTCCIIFGIYLNDEKHSGNFGNASPVTTSPAEPTYKK